MNPADINRTPTWVNDTIWYQIFPDRFCNGTPEKNGDDITPWIEAFVNARKWIEERK